MQVAARYGFGYVVDRLHLEHHVVGRKILARRMVALAEEPPGVRLRRLLEDLGPTFIKFGQILSTRPDILPPAYMQELVKLQDEVPPFEYDVAEHIVRTDLGAPVGELFGEFSRQPVASASLAQVHEGRLRTGEEVVVKIQRPGIAATVASDIEILTEAARLAERYIEEARLFDPVGIVEEFRSTIERELDFTVEASNTERFRENFAGDGCVVIPRTYRQLSTRRVLTLEKVRGIKITDIDKLAAAGLDRRQVARNGADAILKQIFEFGFFHADPHPGNVRAWVGNRIIFLDFGMVGHLSDRLRDHLSDILVGFINRNIPAIRDAFLAVGTAETAVNVARLDTELEDLVYRYYNRPLKEWNMGGMLLELLHLVARHRIRLPPDLFLLSKVLITVDGTGRTLDADFNLVEQAKPFVRDLERRRRSPRAVAHEAQVFLQSMLRFARSLPRDLGVIFSKLKQGTLKVEFEHRGLETLTVQIDKASSRIALSLITAALIIGSSIITHANIGPRYFGYSVLGLAGFVAAGILGVWLFIIILSTGRL
jgi:ubiquinone biosynthesis protein